MKPLIVKEILREYERDRLKAEALLAQRKAEIYKKIPRIEEINQTLSQTGLFISKQILQGDDNYENLLQNLEQRNNILIEEKNALLHKYGYDDDLFAYKCKACKDTGFVNNKKCRCFSQKLMDKFYEYSNLKNVLDKQNFTNFKLDYFSDEHLNSQGVSSRKNIEFLYKRSIYFIDNFKLFFVNLLLTGDTGLGKTFFCSCIAKEILDKGYTVLYLTAAQIFKQVEKERFNESDRDADYVNMIYDVDLLIIDDLGTEFSTSVTDSELFNIINIRIIEERATIISTNMTLKNFGEYYSRRLVSRLIGSYEQWHFFGKDIRQLKKYHSYTIS